MAVKDCYLIDLQEIPDPRGRLGVIEGGVHIPFDIKRFYYVHGVPAGGERGGHAHIALEQFMVVFSGALDVVLDDGAEQKRIRLSWPNKGLYMAPMTWRTLEDFASGTVCGVFASAHYQESDYIRDYEQFLSALQNDP